MYEKKAMSDSGLLQQSSDRDFQARSGGCARMPAGLTCALAIVERPENKGGGTGEIQPVVKIT